MGLLCAPGTRRTAPAEQYSYRTHDKRPSQNLGLKSIFLKKWPEEHNLQIRWGDRMKKRTPMKKESSALAMDTKNKGKGDCVCYSCPTDCGGWGLTLLRVVAGVLFLLHGVMKLTNIAGTMGFFESLGLWGWLAWVVAIVETLGGIALIVGFWTRWASCLLALIMLGALTFVHMQWGAWGWLAVIVAALAVYGLHCSQYGRASSWALGIVLVVVTAAALWMQVAGGINLIAGVERDLLFLAAFFAIAWFGPGRWSMHEQCGCCTH
jgi:uncharacterized membrane protein YphA (DoxX/SURF4 family)